MEYLQVFNKEKKILNEKVDRKNKYKLPDGKYFMIALIFIENSEGKFLMQKTSKERHSCIATTGGHVAFGDTGFETIIREVKEELGLELLPEDINYVDTVIYKNCYLETYYAKKSIDVNSIVIQESEVEYVDWYSEEEILKFIETKEFREGNIKPFELVLKYKSN